jgi:hypothetical protein
MQNGRLSGHLMRTTAGVSSASINSITIESVPVDGAAGQFGNFGHGDLASLYEFVGSPGPAVFQHRPGRSTDMSNVSRGLRIDLGLSSFLQTVC